MAFQSYSSAAEIVIIKRFSKSLKLFLQMEKQAEWIQSPLNYVTPETMLFAESLMMSWNSIIIFHFAKATIWIVLIYSFYLFKYFLLYIIDLVFCCFNLH